MSALVGAPGQAVAHDRDEHHSHRTAFHQINLVSDVEGFGAALLDADVKNPWGIGFGPQTPLWVSNQFSDTITIYRGATPSHPAIEKVPLVISANDPTGLVFNPTDAFKIRQGGVKAKANFLFNENLNVFDAEPAGPPTGQISGWSGASAPPPQTTVVKVSKANSAYGGLALVPAHHGRGPLLLAANGFGSIDVYDAKFRPVHLGSTAFVDPHAAEQQLAPYNVAYLKGRVYVAYAAESSAVSVFDTRGRFLKRLVTNGPLAAPWGMAIAPKSWGRFGGALLVGNVEDGKINAFNRRSGRFLGVLKDDSGAPLINEGLWGIKFGNNVIGTPDTLVFAAGVGDEIGHEVYEHGLIGLIEPEHLNKDDDD